MKNTLHTQKVLAHLTTNVRDEQNEHGELTEERAQDLMRAINAWRGRETRWAAPLPENTNKAGEVQIPEGVDLAKVAAETAAATGAAPVPKKKAARKRR